MKLLLHVACVILITISSHTTAKQRTVGIITNLWCGEYELANKIKIAGEHLGWKIDIITVNKLNNESLLTTDFVLVLTVGAPYLTACPNYLCIMDPVHYHDSSGRFDPNYKFYDGYLSTLTEHRYIEGLDPCIIWYPSSFNTSFYNGKPSNLFHLIGCWGDRKDSKKYQTFYQLLDLEEKVHFYGVKFTESFAPKHHKGKIPFDGKSVIKKQQKAGIVLILHSHIHLENGIPSGRIFEAASASAVIISDLHPFIVKHFGDSVLYIDQNKTAEEMAEQVKDHLQWIHSHPEEAKLLAKRAHNIFISEYTLESQLLAIERFHEKQQSRKNIITKNLDKTTVSAK